MKKSLTLKTVALAMASVYLCQQVLFAQELPSANEALKMPALTIFPKIARVELPPELGSRVEQHGTNPSIILIQDAHGHSEAQKNTAALLDYLRRETKFDALFLEGAIGSLKADRIRFFKDDSKTIKTAEALMEQSDIGGAEYFLLKELTREGKEFPAYGIESPGLYFKNFSAYQKAIQAKPDAQKYLEKEWIRLHQKSGKTLNPKLLEFYKKWLGYARQEDLMRALPILEQAARKHLEIDFHDARAQISWPMMTRIVELKKREKKMNQPKAADELKRLAEWADRQSGADKSLSEMLRGEDFLKGVRPHDQGKFSSRRIFWESFYAAFASRGFDFKKYPNLSLWEGSRILEGELEADGLIEEMNRVKDLVFSRLIRSEAESNIIREAEKMLLLEKMTALRLTRSEFDEIVGEKSFQNVPIIKPALRFYRAAFLRDRVMAERLARAVSAHRIKNAVIVAGGFHTQGLTDLLKLKNISYAVFRPHLSALESDEAYQSVMMGRPVSAPSLAEKTLRAFSWVSEPRYFSRLPKSNRRRYSMMRQSFAGNRSEARVETFRGVDRRGFMPLEISESKKLADKIYARLGGQSLLEDNPIQVGGKSYAFDWDLNADGGMRMMRLGPLMFVTVHPQSTTDLPEKFLEMKNSLGDLYENNQGNILIHAPTSYAAMAELGKQSLSLHAMMAIAAMMNHREMFKGRIAIDLGSGDGILARLALKLGAARVILIDSDRAELYKASSLLTLEGWEAGKDFQIETGDLTDPHFIDRLRMAAEPAEAVVANIGPWPHYGKANLAAMKFAASLSNAKLILNGGYLSDSQNVVLTRTHDVEMEEVKRILKVHNFDKTEILNSRSNGLSAQLIAAARSEVRGEEKGEKIASDMRRLLNEINQLKPTAGGAVKRLQIDFLRYFVRDDLGGEDNVFSAIRFFRDKVSVLKSDIRPLDLKEIAGAFLRYWEGLNARDEAGTPASDRESDEPLEWQGYFSRFNAHWKMFNSTSKFLGAPEVNYQAVRDSQSPVRLLSAALQAGMEPALQAWPDFISALMRLGVADIQIARHAKSGTPVLNIQLHSTYQADSSKTQSRNIQVVLLKTPITGRDVDQPAKDYSLEVESSEDVLRSFAFARGDSQEKIEKAMGALFETALESKLMALTSHSFYSAKGAGRLAEIMGRTSAEEAAIRQDFLNTLERENERGRGKNIREPQTDAVRKDLLKRIANWKEVSSVFSVFEVNDFSGARGVLQRAQVVGKHQPALKELFDLEVYRGLIGLLLAFSEDGNWIISESDIGDLVKRIAAYQPLLTAGVPKIRRLAAGYPDEFKPIVLTEFLIALLRALPKNPKKPFLKTKMQDAIRYLIELMRNLHGQPESFSPPSLPVSQNLGDAHKAPLSAEDAQKKIVELLVKPAKETVVPQMLDVIGTYESSMIRKDSSPAPLIELDSQEKFESSISALDVWVKRQIMPAETAESREYSQLWQGMHALRKIIENNDYSESAVKEAGKKLQPLLPEQKQMIAEVSSTLLEDYGIGLIEKIEAFKSEKKWQDAMNFVQVVSQAFRGLASWDQAFSKEDVLIRAELVKEKQGALSSSDPAERARAIESDYANELKEDENRLIREFLQHILRNESYPKLEKLRNHLTAHQRKNTFLTELQKHALALTEMAGEKRSEVRMAEKTAGGKLVPLIDYFDRIIPGAGIELFRRVYKELWSSQTPKTNKKKRDAMVYLFAFNRKYAGQLDIPWPTAKDVLSGIGADYSALASVFKKLEEIIGGEGHNIPDWQFKRGQKMPSRKIELSEEDLTRMREYLEEGLDLLSESDLEEQKTADGYSESPMDPIQKKLLRRMESEIPRPYWAMAGNFIQMAKRMADYLDRPSRAKRFIDKGDLDMLELVASEQWRQKDMDDDIRRVFYLLLMDPGNSKYVLYHPVIHEFFLGLDEAMGIRRHYRVPSHFLRAIRNLVGRFNRDYTVRKLSPVDPGAQSARSEARSDSGDAAPSIHEPLISQTIFDRIILRRGRRSLYQPQLFESSLIDLSPNAVSHPLKKLISHAMVFLRENLITPETQHLISSFNRETTVLTIDIPTVFFHDDATQPLTRVMQISFRRKAIILSKKFLDSLNPKSDDSVEYIAKILFAGQSLLDKYDAYLKDMDKKGKTRGLLSRSLLEAYQAVNDEAGEISLGLTDEVLGFAQYFESKRAGTSLDRLDKEYRNAERDRVAKSVDGLKQEIVFVEGLFKEWNDQEGYDPIMQIRKQQQIVQTLSDDKDSQDFENDARKALVDKVLELQRTGFFYSQAGDKAQAAWFYEKARIFLEAILKIDPKGLYPFRVQTRMIYFMIRTGDIDGFQRELIRLVNVDYVPEVYRALQKELQRPLLSIWAQEAALDLFFKLQFYKSQNHSLKPRESASASENTIEASEKILIELYKDSFNLIERRDEQQRKKFGVDLMKVKEDRLDRPFRLFIPEYNEVMEFSWERQKLESGDWLGIVKVYLVMGSVERHPLVGKMYFNFRKVRDKVTGTEQWEVFSEALEMEGGKMSQPIQISPFIFVRYPNIAIVLVKLALKLASSSGAGRFHLVMDPAKREGLKLFVSTNTAGRSKNPHIIFPIRPDHPYIKDYAELKVEVTPDSLPRSEVRAEIEKPYIPREDRLTLEEEHRIDHLLGNLDRADLGAAAKGTLWSFAQEHPGPFALKMVAKIAQWTPNQEKLFEEFAVEYPRYAVWPLLQAISNGEDRKPEDFLIRVGSLYTDRIMGSIVSYYASNDGNQKEALRRVIPQVMRNQKARVIRIAIAELFGDPADGESALQFIEDYIDQAPESWFPEIASFLESSKSRSRAEKILRKIFISREDLRPGIKAAIYHAIKKNKAKPTVKFYGKLAKMAGEDWGLPGDWRHDRGGRSEIRTKLSLKDTKLNSIDGKLNFWTLIPEQSENREKILSVTRDPNMSKRFALPVNFQFARPEDLLTALERLFGLQDAPHIAGIIIDWDAFGSWGEGIVSEIQKHDKTGKIILIGVGNRALAKTDSAKVIYYNPFNFMGFTDDLAVALKTKPSTPRSSQGLRPGTGAKLPAFGTLGEPRKEIKPQPIPVNELKAYEGRRVRLELGIKIGRDGIVKGEIDAFIASVSQESPDKAKLRIYRVSVPKTIMYAKGDLLYVRTRAQEMNWRLSIGVFPTEQDFVIYSVKPSPRSEARLPVPIGSESVLSESAKSEVRNEIKVKDVFAVLKNEQMYLGQREEAVRSLDQFSKGQLAGFETRLLDFANAESNPISLRAMVVRILSGKMQYAESDIPKWYRVRRQEMLENIQKAKSAPRVGSKHQLIKKIDDAWVEMPEETPWLLDNLRPYLDGKAGGDGLGLVKESIRALGIIGPLADEFGAADLLETLLRNTERKWKIENEVQWALSRIKSEARSEVRGEMEKSIDISALNRLSATDLLSWLRLGYANGDLAWSTAFSEWDSSASDKKRISGAVVFLRKIDGEWSFLLGQKKVKKLFVLPGGGIDNARNESFETQANIGTLLKRKLALPSDIPVERETVPAGVLRELAEEAGISEAEIAGRLSDVWDPKSEKLTHYFIALDSSTKKAITPQDKELEKFKWIPLGVIFEGKKRNVAARLKAHVRHGRISEDLTQVLDEFLEIIQKLIMALVWQPVKSLEDLLALGVGAKFQLARRLGNGHTSVMRGVLTATGTSGYGVGPVTIQAETRNISITYRLEEGGNSVSYFTEEDFKSGAVTISVEGPRSELRQTELGLSDRLRAETRSNSADSIKDSIAKKKARSEIRQSQAAAMKVAEEMTAKIVARGMEWLVPMLFASTVTISEDAVQLERVALAELLKQSANVILPASLMVQMDDEARKQYLGLIKQAAESVKQKTEKIIFSGAEASSLAEIFSGYEVFRGAPEMYKMVQTNSSDENILADRMKGKAVSASFEGLDETSNLALIPSFKISKDEFIRLKPNDQFQYMAHLTQLQLLAAEALKDQLSDKAVNRTQVLRDFLTKAGIQFREEGGFLRPSTQSLIAADLTKLVQTYQLTSKAA